VRIPERINTIQSFGQIYEVEKISWSKFSSAGHIINGSILSIRIEGLVYSSRSAASPYSRGARLLREIIDLNEKRRKIEADLRTADVRNKLLIESAARKDIEAYKNRHVVADVAFAMITTDNLSKQI
jgi:hypothetical protein